ncbi:translocation and assembly module lipoprotein TamL [Limnovirga soli]|uniref:BamA/TamA family outer membrane protein n=1 Tax=Limnovirga soli TaxID=2656915 RepID=A0A8J8JV84_9BACT|nr:BamA/TamA family outer membrane protein [Limnovirga soli]NNV57110.1 BamA/TamA family outer membrane protein [Limnovirga soli]
MHKIGYLILIFLFALATSCSVTKSIPANDALYNSATIKLRPADSSSKLHNKDLVAELNSLLRPVPNASFLGIKYKLLIYNLAGTPTGKGIRYWAKNKLGEPPVLASSVNITKNSGILQNRLENRGYFGATVAADSVTKKQQFFVTYTANITTQYTLQTVTFKTDSSAVGLAIQKTREATLLQPGKAYDLDIIKAERERIDAALKEEGFFYFNPDFIIVNIDSALGNHTVNLYLTLKKETPAKAKKSYSINDVIVYADYNLENDTASIHAKEQATRFNNFYIFDPEKKFNPKVFTRTLVFKPGDVYNRAAHNQSLNRLVSLGMYKFVRARFQEVDTMPGSHLNALYYLTPKQKKSLRLEVSALTKSNNSSGGEVSLNWLNRNFLKGAELFTVKVFGGLQKQVAAQQPTISTNRLGIEANLIVPRILAPFKFTTNSNYVPQTKSTLGYEIFQRNTQYTLSSAKASFGYIWKESAQKEHQLDIISLNLVQPRAITPEFQAQLDTNITLARSIEKQFIIGSNYNFNYNSQVTPNNKRNNFYFNGNLDMSGNLYGLLSGADVQAGKERTIFGLPFSQYVRTEIDVRYYLKTGPKNLLATRLLAGLGYAYGNSVSLPFVKAFFAGGTNDIRAFRARALGPGSYYAGNAAVLGFLPDQPGDIKLELNTEYRAKLFSFLYGAAFIDAGNTWLLREDAQRPGGKITNAFLNDIAVGAGLGLRVDVGFFVVRLDAAIPIRKPYVTGSKWVFNAIDFGNEDWRQQNLILNLAIGYPF